MPQNNSSNEAVLGEVFISYSWDSDEHLKTVREFSDRLRSEGIDAIIDQYEESPPEGWPRWMEKKIRDSRLVLMICTEEYYKKGMGEAPPDTGLGVKWEGGLIYQYLYNAGANNQKFIPVLFRGTDKQFIPTPVQSATYYQVNTDAGYDKLYARLLNRPGVPKPELGPIRPLPKKEVKTNISMFVTGPIDVDLWNKAKWHSTFLARWPNEGPPALGFGFLNEQAARKIFEQWHERYGDRDTFEELRVSIIEGEIKGERPGYTVHIGADLDNTIKRYRDQGLTVGDNDILMTIGRVNRMNPTPGSTTLQMFKEDFRRFKTYFLIPGIHNSDSSLVPISELGIFKNTIHFRNVAEIRSRHDPDFSVVQPEPAKRSKKRRHP
jgi:hypothetical protein